MILMPRSMICLVKGRWSLRREGVARHAPELVAQSMAEPLILLTADAALGPYGSTVRVI
jgi:hypothetical protein